MNYNVMPLDSHFMSYVTILSALLLGIIEICDIHLTIYDKEP